MAEFYRYDKETGYGYSLSEHAKLRIWERFETLDIDREFYLYHKLLTMPVIDDTVIANMDIGDEAIIKNCQNNKVYVFVLSDRLSLQLKTVYSQRKTHRLPEWRAFCEQLKELPLSEFITGEETQ